MNYKAVFAVVASAIMTSAPLAVAKPAVTQTVKSSASNNNGIWSSPEVARLFPGSVKARTVVLPPTSRSANPRSTPIMMQASGDYLKDAVAEGVKRWPSGRFPLRVFIGQGRPDHRQAMVEAMASWSSLSGGRFKLVQTNDPGSADILVDWAGRPNNGPDGSESGETRTQCGVDPFSGYQVINRAYVTILTAIRGQAVSADEMKKTCLHELGHALGMAHSNHSSDIMYWQSNFGQSLALTGRDATTLQKLYSL